MSFIQTNIHRELKHKLSNTPFIKNYFYVSILIDLRTKLGIKTLYNTKSEA